MLDFGATQQDQQPFAGRVARVEPPSLGEAFAGAMEANDRVDGQAAEFRNQNDFFQSKVDAFTAKTGIDVPKLRYSGISAADFDKSYNDWMGGARDVMQRTSVERNDPSLAPPSDSDVVLGGINNARSAVAKQAELSRSPFGPGVLLGRTAASGAGMVKDPYNLISLTALGIAPEGAPLLTTALRTAGAMGGQQLVSDVARYSYRQAVNPDYGVGDVASDVAEAAVGGALFGAGQALGGQGVRGALGAAAGGAGGGGAFGAIGDGPQGALEGAVGGAALPLAGAGFGGLKALGMSWRAFKARSPDLAMNMPLSVRDAGDIAEKAGDLQAQKPNWPGPQGDAAHADALGAAEDAVLNDKPLVMPQSAVIEAAARRGQVFFPGGTIDARYDLAEHVDLVTSHDSDFNVRPDYPAELQPRDRSGAPARDQVNQIAGALEPERLGPSPEANSGAPIIGPDGVVESGNGRVLAIGQAYERGRGEAYRAWLEQQGYDTTGYDKPVLIGMRETPLDPVARAGFAHAANGSAALRMSATEQALSDARHLEPSLVELAKTADLAAASNREFARAFVAKLPAGERGGMLTREGTLSANGVRRATAALAARAYGDPAFLSRALDHPDPNIKAIAGAMSDAAGPWARMRDAATRGDIEPGHDITRDVLQAVHAIMRARDEGRPAWEMLNQGDIFQSDTTQMASRMFFRDEAMRQPAGRARVAEALTRFAEDSVKNTSADRLFDDAVSPGDVLRRLMSSVLQHTPDGDQFVLASVRRQRGMEFEGPREIIGYHGTGAAEDFARFDPQAGHIETERGANFFSVDPQFADSYAHHNNDAARIYKVRIDPGKTQVFDLPKMLQGDDAETFLSDVRRAWIDGMRQRGIDVESRAGDISAAWDSMVAKIYADLKDQGEINAAFDTGLSRYGERVPLDMIDPRNKKAPSVAFDGALTGAVMKRAKRLGLDTAVIRGMREGQGGRPSDQIMVLNTDRIRPFWMKPEEIPAALDTASQDALAMARRNKAADGEAVTEATAVGKLAKAQEPRLTIDWPFGGKMRVTARQLEREAASRQAWADHLRNDGETERADYNDRAAQSLRDSLTAFEGYKPGDRAKPFTPAKLIDAGNKFVVSVATDGRHGVSDSLKTFRIFDKPNEAVARQRDLGAARGLVDIEKGADGRWEVKMVEVAPGMRGQGVATALYGAVQKELGIEMSPSGILLPDGYAFWKKRDPEKVQWHQPVDRGGDTGEAYFSPKRLGVHAEEGGPNAEKYRAAYDALPPEAKTQAALDAMFSLRQMPDNAAPRTRETSNESDARPDTAGTALQPDLTVRNGKTGEAVQAQEVAPLKDMFKQFDVSRDAGVDILTRASSMAMGDRLGRLIGDMKVYTVGPAEMRALAAERMKIQPGFEPAGFYDRKGHIVVLDDAMRDPREAAALLVHEGMHAAFMETIENSDAATNVVDHLRSVAEAAHLSRGGAAADHYGLTNAHEFVSEAFSNSQFQRFLASIPADARMVEAFGLDKAPGSSLWDVFVGAVRKILGMAPDQHTLLDATLRLGDLLEQRRAELMRGDGDDLAPMLRPMDVAKRRSPEDEAGLARAFATVTDRAKYEIGSAIIAQHPDGPRAGFLSLITRDPNERSHHANAESLGAWYQDKMAAMVGQMTEAYGSKWAGLKQDVAGFRDVIGELFNVDTKNATAKAVADAMRKADEWATGEAKRLGKVFSPAEDWRMVQWWESSRALKFGQRVLRADMESEIDAGGLKVFDPETHEPADPLRIREILDSAVERIASDASLGGGVASGGGAFKTDMRVFRFTEGEAGRDAYLRLMDKYGVGSGNYLSAMQTHYARIGRELGMMQVLGPGYLQVGEKLRDHALVAARKIRAEQEPRTTAQRLRDLPKDAGKFLFSWLDSENRVKATWQHMSGQASGVGSELTAGIMAGARSYEVATKMGSAVLTAVPADTVNAMMAAKYLGMDQGRLLQKTFEAFLKDSPHLREEAERLGIAAHAGIDAAIGTKRFADQVLGDRVMQRMADFVIRAQGLHAWDNALRRVFIQEFFGTIGQRAGVAFENLDKPFAHFLEMYGFKAADWAEMSRPEHMLHVGEAKYLHLDNINDEPLRLRLASAAYDQRQLAYIAGGTERVRSIGTDAKAGTFAGELGKSALMFKSFAMTLQATWGKRAMNEAGQGRYGTAATLLIGMTFAGALATQARSIVQGKDPRNMKDPWFWAESTLQGGALGYWGDFFHNAFSRSDTSLTESLLGPLATIPASFQSLTSGARRAAEDGERVNFGAKLARILGDAPPGGSLWYGRLLKQRLIMDQIQHMIDPEWRRSFARQQQRSMKTNHQGFWWAPGASAPGRGPDLGAMLQ